MTVMFEGKYLTSMSKEQLIEVVKTLLLLIKDSRERADQLRELLILEKEPIKTLTNNEDKGMNDKRKIADEKAFKKAMKAYQPGGVKYQRK